MNICHLAWKSGDCHHEQPDYKDWILCEPHEPQVVRLLFLLQTLDQCLLRAESWLWMLW